MSRSKQKDNRASRDMSQFGLMSSGLPDGLNDEDHDDDLGLEDELNALMGIGPSGATKKKKPASKMVNPQELDAMVNACMMDVENDDDIDDEDPELMNELEGMMSEDETTTKEMKKPQHPIYASNNLLQIVESRIEMYASAEIKAKNNNDNSRARRYNRGLGTLKIMKKQIESGKSVNEDDIPPAIAMSLSSTSTVKESHSNEPPTITPVEVPENISNQYAFKINTQNNNQVTNVEPVKNNQPDIISELRRKKESYKSFALHAKKEGNKLEAMNGLKAMKITEELIKTAQSGSFVDISTLPDLQSLKAIETKSSDQSIPPMAHAKVERSFSRDDPIKLPEKPEDIPPADPAMFGAPPPPATILEALNQRLEKFKADESKAKNEGNNSKARRYGRICKQYEDAIRAHKCGKPIPLEDLPTPIGFPPIPSSDKISSPNPKVNSASTSTQSTPVVKKAPTPPVSATKSKPMSLIEKQLDLLTTRQTLFKKAALEAKKSGQIEQAKEYLKQSKGFDKLIEATNSGLPVDINTLPVPPQLQKKDVEMGFEIISKEDAVEIGNRQEMYSKLEGDLIAQIKMCSANRSRFKSTGDIPSANTFQQKEEHSKKDLDALRFAFKRGDPVPKFHYEIRSFSKVQCNIDLSDTECEVSGINYMGSKEIDTYVRYEFPYPKETPFKDKTETIKDSINPSYEHKTLIPINVKERSAQRVFKRGTLKCDVMVKGGFLRSDTVLGSIQVKLQPLETQCTLHESFALMDGRKAVGGKLEVKIRLRNPIVTKQIEKVQEKWLVITF